ncbi:MAG: ABC transporter permease subunit [Planctomycetaceae bacterium]
MSWRNIKLVFLREVRDQLRDRRTLFMIAVLPLLLYPVMGIGMVQMTLMFSEQPRTVVILGAENLPKEPRLIDKGRFPETLFRIGADSQKLNVVTNLSVMEGGEHAEDRRLVGLVEQARDIQSLVEEKRNTENPQRISMLNHEIGKLMSNSRLQVLVIIPEGFAENIEKANLQFSRQLARGKASEADISDYRRPEIVWNKADEKSQIAYRRVKEAMDNWDKAIFHQRLAVANLPTNFSDPVGAVPVDVAEKGQLSANLWSKLFPALLVIMAVTGAFYPAVDLAAGEKERGTMETLLICPASRSEIVIGKFFTVMAFSMSTALLNLLSIGLTGKYMVSIAGGGALTKFSSLAPPTASAMLWVVILLIPVAALFSALSLSLATFARSSKEGQYYLTPLLIVTMGLTIFCLSPEIEIAPFYSVMPVIGPTLLLKGLLSSSGDTTTLYYAIPVLVTSIGYSLLALWWAIDQFSRESVLFRESERFELGLWIRHILRDKQQTPSFAEGGFLFVVIMLLQFGAMKFMQDIIGRTAPEGRGIVMLQMLVVQQVAIIATPALIMGLILTSSMKETFRLRLPHWKYLLLASLLPFVLHPLSLELSATLAESFFPPLPKGAASQIGLMSNPDVSLGVILLVFAVAPAVCEEIAFRGFILSGFSQSQRLWLAIALSSLTFGVMHMIPQQVFNAALLGLVLGLLAVRSNSLLPGIIFHMIFNALAIIHSRLGQLDEHWIHEAPGQWFVSIYGETIRYQWTTLIIAAGLSIVLLRWLVNQPGPSQETDSKSDSSEQQRPVVPNETPVNVS